MGKKCIPRSQKDKQKAIEQQLRAAIQQLRASEQQLRAANQQLQASEQQLRAANQQLDAGNQQLRASQEELRRANHDLQERVKDLECLYGLSRLDERGEASLQEIMEGLVNLIPPGWQYPEITGARIIFGKQRFKTDNFRKTAWMQSADIKVHGQKAGTIEVCYRKKQPEIDEGPYLKEERELLNALATRVGRIAERKRAQEALAQSEEQLKQFFENEPQYCYMISPEGMILNVNHAALKALGYKKEQLVGKPVKTIYAPESLPKMKEVFAKWKKTGRLKDEELVIITKQGGRRVVLLSAAVVKDQDGKTLHSVSVQKDITDRKRAEEALRASEQQLRASNEQLRASEQQLKATNQQLRASEQQLRAANEQLLGYQAQLKSLASQLTLTEEHERRRIATELHAQVSQSLATCKLMLDMLRTAELPPNAADTLDEVCKLLEQMIDETRTLTFDLSSPILHELGFEKAVAAWLTERIRKKHGIATEFEDDHKPKPLGADISAALFRDVRELLANVVKHAQAKNVRVSIGRIADEMHVRVEDDGWGFDPAEVAAKAVKTGAFGLFSIRERLEQLGGRLTVDSKPGHGTTVTLTAPFKGTEKETGDKNEYSNSAG